MLKINGLKFLKLSNEDIAAGTWYGISIYEYTAKYNEGTPYPTWEEYTQR